MQQLRSNDIINKLIVHYHYDTYGVVHIDP